MPFGKFATCANFARVLELGTLAAPSVTYLLRQHSNECDCDCDLCNSFRRQLTALEESSGDTPFFRK